MLIYSYTAEDAINDGFLHDVSEMAKEAGFKWPVRITAGVFDLVKPSDSAKQYGQSFKGRLWDVLNMARLAVRRASPDETLTTFEVIFQDGPKIRKTKELWAALDTTFGPAIHIMLPSEY